MTDSIVIPGFEGSEKKLVVDFCSDVAFDLRRMPRAEIDAFLTAAKCTIISQTSTEELDSYVLSESSLFIYPNQVIVKTCGTTSLLYCLPKLLESAAKLQAKPDFVAFSRANYKFPEVQPDVHRDFDSEVNYLNQYFDGQAFILGPLNGARWHLYVADIQKNRNHTREQTFEVVMTNLDPKAMAAFYRKPEDPEALTYHAKVVTSQTGIEQLLPGFVIDDFLFNPCGYSCNGVKDDSYFTIHITPEPHCSFVSFETNAKLESYNELLTKVLAIFRPATFSVSLFCDNNSKLGNSQLGLDWVCGGYDRQDCSYHEFASECNIAYGNFVSLESSLQSVSAVPVSMTESAENKADESCVDKIKSANFASPVLLQLDKIDDVSSLLSELGLPVPNTLPVLS